MNHLEFVACFFKLKFKSKIFKSKEYMRNTLWALATVVILVQAGCSKKIDDVVVDASTPVIASGITVSSRTGTSFNIAWTAATDDATPASALQYKILYSTSNNISTAADANANGTMVQDWTTNLTSGTISSLQQVQAYYIAVLVRDTDLKVGIATVNTTTLCSGKRIFLATVSNAAFGGKAGADAACTAQKPVGITTAKAILSNNVATPNTRSLCNTTPTPPGTGGESCTSSNTYIFDWVLAASANVCTTDFENLVGTTNAFKALTTINSGVLSATPTKTFTGMNIAWGNSPGSNCSDWTSTTGTGIYGSAASNGSGFVSAGQYSCASPATLYCVEQ